MNNIIVVGEVNKATSLLEKNTKVSSERKKFLLEALEKGVYEVSQNCSKEEYREREAQRLKKIHNYFGEDVSRVYLYEGEKSTSSDTKGWYKIGQQVYNPGFYEVKNDGEYSYLLYKGPHYSTSFHKSSLDTSQLLNHVQIAYENSIISKETYQFLNQKYV